MRRSFVVIIAGMIVVLGVLALVVSNKSALPEYAGVSEGSNGQFTLVTQDGKLFRRASLAGRPYVIYFGYASCPDRCPMMLARIGRMRAQMGAEGRNLAILFVTVDPERDTPDKLRQFVLSLGTPIIALTGNPEAVHRVADAAGIFSKRVEGEGGNYSIEHTTNAFVYDSTGSFWDTIAPEESDAAILAKLHDAVRAPGGGGSEGAAPNAQPG